MFFKTVWPKDIFRKIASCRDVHHPEGACALALRGACQASDIIGGS
jgi:hypothetical protein